MRMSYEWQFNQILKRTLRSRLGELCPPDKTAQHRGRLDNSEVRYVHVKFLVKELARHDPTRRQPDQVLDQRGRIKNDQRVSLSALKMSAAAVPISTRPRASIRLFNSSMVGVSASRLRRARAYSERLCPDFAARDFKMRETSSGTFLICSVVMHSA